MHFKILIKQVLRKEKKDAMARWVVANDVTLEQVTRYLLRCFLINPSVCCPMPLSIIRLTYNLMYH